MRTGTTEGDKDPDGIRPELESEVGLEPGIRTSGKPSGVEKVPIL